MAAGQESSQRTVTRIPSINTLSPVLLIHNSKKIAVISGFSSILITFAAINRQEKGIICYEKGFVFVVVGFTASVFPVSV
jgi:hypothetical protein